MKFCADHWDRLRKAIDARGLSALIADSGEKAASNLASEVNEGQTIDNYDPLMSAHNAILSNAMDAAGPDAMSLFTTKPDGSDWCPICFLNERSTFFWEQYKDHAGQPCPCAENCGQMVPEAAPTWDDWIDRAADDQIEVWTSFRAASQ